jgi:hypothetical protein
MKQDRTFAIILAVQILCFITVLLDLLMRIFRIKH